MILYSYRSNKPLETAEQQASQSTDLAPVVDFSLTCQHIVNIHSVLNC